MNPQQKTEMEQIIEAFDGIICDNTQPQDNTDLDDLIDSFQSVMMRTPDENFLDLKDLYEALQRAYKTGKYDTGLLFSVSGLYKRIIAYLVNQKGCHQNCDCHDCIVVDMIQDLDKLNNELDYIKGAMLINKYIIKTIEAKNNLDTAEYRQIQEIDQDAYTV